MTTLKSIIVNDIPATLTDVYTNSTGSDAALKGLNVSHTAQVTDYTSAASSADGWSWLPGQTTFCVGSSGTRGDGAPAFVKLADDTILAITAQYSMYGSASNAHFGGSSNSVTLQILNFDGTKYRSGPIFNMAAETTVYSWASNSSLPLASGVAVSATNAVFGVAGRLYNVVISGNVITNVHSLNASSFSSNGRMVVCRVPGSTSKVVVVGSNGSVLQARAYTIPADAAPTAIGGSNFSLGLTDNGGGSPGAFDADQLIANEPTYTAACFTASTTVQAVNFTFNPTTDAFNIDAAATTVNSAQSQSYSLSVLCVSTGTTPNSVVVFPTGSTTLSFYRQTSKTSINGSSASSVSTNAWFHCSHKAQIKDGCSVLMGGGVVFVNQSGVTKVQDGTSNNGGYAYPFGSRWLYPINHQPRGFFAYSGSTPTSIGTSITTRQYIPVGIPDGRLFQYHANLGGTLAAFGSSLFLLDASGNVLSQRDVSSVEVIKCLTISPAGRVAVGSSPQGSAISCSTGSQSVNMYWSSTSTPVTAANFTTVTFSTATGAAQGFTILDVEAFIDGSGVERFATLYQMWDSASGYSRMQFNSLTFGQTSAVGNSTWGFGSAGSFFGLYGMGKILQVTAASAANNGTWRLVFVHYNSNQNLYVSAPVTLSLSPSNDLGSAPSVAVSSYTPHYPMSYSKETGGCAVSYAPDATSIAMYASANGVEIINGYSNTSKTSSGSTVAITSNAVTLVFGSSFQYSVAPSIYHFVGGATTPTQTVNAGSASRTLPTPVPSQYEAVTFGGGLNNAMASYGLTSSSVRLILSSGSTDFNVTPVTGTPVAIGAVSRSNDVYYIPPGYKLKMSQSVPSQLDAMLTILEEA